MFVAGAARLSRKSWDYREGPGPHGDTRLDYRDSRGTIAKVDRCQRTSDGLIHPKPRAISGKSDAVGIL